MNALTHYSSLSMQALRHPNRARIMLKFRPFTMVPANLYFVNLELANRARNIPGAIVECGTWKGGMIGGIASLLGPERQYHLFDSYEGLPPATEKDGAEAKNWQADPKGSFYFDNCTASIEDAKKAMSIAGAKNVEFNKGWFSNTLPGRKFPDGIALLRMDADWYDSTMQILDNLFHQVVPGGVILVDDYFMWEGCSKAIHHFLDREHRTERIQSCNDVCFLIKSAETAGVIESTAASTSASS